MLSSTFPWRSDKRWELGQVGDLKPAENYIGLRVNCGRFRLFVGRQLFGSQGWVREFEAGLLQFVFWIGALGEAPEAALF